MNHDEHIREALALDALGTLDGGLRDTLAEHVAACEECAGERQELVAVAALLAHAAPPVVPPAALRARLLERVRELGPADSGSAAVSTAPNDARAEGSAETGRVLRPSPERFRRRAAPAWVSYGALAASLVLAALLFLSWRENGALRRELASAGRESRGAQDALERRLADSVREREELRRQFAELLTAPGADMAHLAGTKDAPQARASFAYDRETGRALLITTGLPAAPAGKEYQLWYFEDKTPLPGPAFNTDAEGRASLNDTIPAEWRDARAFAVTLEPAGGVQVPTGGVYLASPAS